MLTGRLPWSGFDSYTFRRESRATEATILRFGLGRAVLDALIGAVDGLYQWRQPRRPEDLALVRADGTALLVSICHESDGYLDATDEELASIAAAVPELARIARPAAER